MTNRRIASVLVALLAAACSDARRGQSPFEPTIQEAIGTDPVTGATIETNLDDYLPGQVIHVTGRSWAPRETVVLFMSEEPDTHADITMNVVADSSGAFAVDFYDVQQHDLGVTFTLTATGRTSGSVATAVFTDNRILSLIELLNPATSTYVVAPAQITVSGGSSVGVRATGTTDTEGGGASAADDWLSTRWQLRGPSPSNGVAASGCAENINITTATVNAQHAFTVTAPSGAGTYSLSLVAFRSDGCVDGPSADLTYPNGVVVTAAPANTAPSLTITDKTVNEHALLTFTAAATDTDVPAQTLTYTLVGTPPAGASITIGGVFSWTPSEAQGPGTYSITVRVTDNGSPAMSTDASFNVQVNEVNAAPILNPIGNKSVDEGSLLSFLVTANDGDLPANALTFSLDPGAPTGASITAGGLFTWTPTEAQGPNTYSVTVRVTDNGSPALSSTEAITIQVREVNNAPVLAAIGNKTVDEETQLSFTATANDPDLPPNTLTYTLDAGAPAGASITAAGVFTWTPTEAQGPGNYTVTVRVTDSGTPPLSDYETITIEVKEVNVAPVLAAIGNKIVDEETQLSFTAAAGDADLPANVLTFTLDAGAPAGASITTGGVFSWTPTEAQGPGNYTVTVRVTDNGTPALSDYETITIEVKEVNVAPVLAAISDKTVDEGSLLSFTASATDADLPPNTLTYSLAGTVPMGATINGSTGQFSWTPTDGPTQSTSITVRVTDNGVPALHHERTFNVTVNNVKPAITNVTLPIAPVQIGSSVTVSWTFTDPGADTWTCKISWDQPVSFGPTFASSGKTCSTTSNSLPAGVYTVTVHVADDDGGTDERTEMAYIVVYDPTGGFVTGGGWINSPAGAFALDAALTGKATFGFVSKYVKGKTLPQGNTEFQFHAGNLNFKSTLYDWLVVAGNRAQYKGEGTIEGMTGTFGFLLTAIDDGNTSGGVNPDKFRIKIWNKTTSQVIYDNQMGQLEDSSAATGLGGGSIVIHAK